MKYLNSELFNWQLITQFVLLLILFTLPLSWSTPIINGIAIVLLVLIGIPHGANDLFYRKGKSKAGIIRFLITYLGTIGLYGILWLAFPIGALLLFLVISIHHFGQSNFEQERLLHIPSILWGALLLAAPILFHWEEALRIFEGMVGRPLYISLPIHWSYAIISIISLIYGWVSWKKYPQKITIRLWLQWIMVLIWLVVSPLLSGFIIVFTLWHSGQSLQYQWKVITMRLTHQPFGKWDLWLGWGLTSIASFLFLGLIHWIWGLNLPLLFILLSMITLPHAIVMHGLYSANESTNKS